MLVMGILIIVHSHLFVGARPSNEEKHLARFRFKKDDETFVSHEKLHLKLGDNYISPALNSFTRLTDKLQRSRYLSVGFPSKFLRLLF